MMQKLGLFLIVVSFLPWAAIAFVLPWLPLTLAQKAVLVPVLLGLAEVLFWPGVLIVGKETAQRYKQFFKQFFSVQTIGRSLKRSFERINRKP